MQKILVNGGKLRLQDLLQHSDDFGIAFHLPPPVQGSTPKRSNISFVYI
jgi:hypothetical protein